MTTLPIEPGLPCSVYPNSAFLTLGLSDSGYLTNIKQEAMHFSNRPYYDSLDDDSLRDVSLNFFIHCLGTYRRGWNDLASCKSGDLVPHIALSYTEVLFLRMKETLDYNCADRISKKKFYFSKLDVLECLPESFLG